ncbi:TonB-dependent receptor plug domain-containing protein [Brevundimonas bullata]|uniref:TonB-dependent receptor plug domain-containing protein n=1 Tax=Brevundimonas bullata TaxID=13160 RepID=UPI002FDA7819
MHLKRTLFGTTILAGVLAISAPAFAQDENATSVGDVVVTGSRIARPNQESPTQVQVVSAEAIANTGEVNLGEILRTLPAAGVSSLTPTNSNFFTQGNGVATVNLRNLGEDRTLVLVNGRRFVAGLPGTQIVDFNSLPTEFIDRVDVVTGGASSIYGSDALAGVVNIITDKDYEGFQMFGQYGITDRGDRENFKVGTKFGSNFADDRGNFVGTLSYQDNKAVYARDRADRGMDRDGQGGLFFADGTFGETRYFYGSSFTPGGVAVVPGIGVNNANRVYDPVTGTVRPYAAADGFDRQAQRQLYVPNSALQFSGQAIYNFDDSNRFFFEGSYYRGTTKSNIEPSPVSGADIFRDAQDVGLNPSCTATGCLYGIPLLSAIVPESVRNEVRARTPGLTDAQRVVGFQRRMTEFGNRQNEATRDLFRVVAGINGELAGSMNLNYEISANWGRSSEQQLTNGGILKDRLINTLDVVDTGGGVLACRNISERARGCQPFKIFEAGGASQGVVDYIAVQNTFDSFVDQKVLNGFISGDLFELPAGPLQFVFGSEYRREESRNTPDATLQQGLASGNIAPETKGEFNVIEGFAELRIPLLADMAFAKQLDLNLSGRLSDYSTVGNTSAWAASVEYMPTDWVKFRTQYSVAVRAPNISELFSGRSQTFPTNLDPCRGLTVSGGQAAFYNTRVDISNPANVAASGINAATVGSDAARACLADPTLAARVARDGVFSQTQAEAQGTGGFNSGNENLKQEESTSFTAGLLFNADWYGWLSPFSLSVDYFNIEIEDIISNLARGTSLNECYVNSGGVYDASSPFCQSIVRYASGTAQVGAMRELNSQTQNLGKFQTSGIDVQASYTFDLNNFPMTRNMSGNWGTLVASVTYQHLDEYKTSPLPGAELVESAGTTGLSKNKAQLDLLYRRDALTVSWQTQFIGESCYFDLNDCADNDVSGYIGLTTFSDLQVRYAITPKATVFAGVDNIFDEYVYIGQGYGQPTGWTTEPAVYDGLGRRFVVGARVSF